MIIYVYYYSNMNKRNFLKITSFTFFYSIFLQIPSNFQSSFLFDKISTFVRKHSGMSSVIDVDLDVKEEDDGE